MSEKHRRIKTLKSLAEGGDVEDELAKSIGMVCGVPFLVALFLLTWGILLLPEYPFASPFLFFACYLIWKKAPAPGLSGYRTLKEVQAVFQEKAEKVDEPPEQVVAVQRMVSCREETDDLDRAA